MQVVNLVGIIFDLSMEVLVENTLVQLLKATSREITAWLGSYLFVIVRKLHCLAEPTYLRVLAPLLKAKRCRY